MTLQAVVFDWGGVVQRTASQASRHALDRELGLEPGSVERAVFGSDVWQWASVGLCSAARAWATIGQRLGIEPEDTDTFVARFFGDDAVDTEIVQLVERLKAEGLAVGLLSNAPPGYGTQRPMLARWGREGLFHRQVFSYQVGALKPDPRTYQAILGALGVAPSGAVFIDDARANVVGARDIGMQAIQFSCVSALERDLRNATATRLAS